MFEVNAWGIISHAREMRIAEWILIEVFESDIRIIRYKWRKRIC